MSSLQRHCLVQVDRHCPVTGAHGVPEREVAEGGTSG